MWYLIGEIMCFVTMVVATVLTLDFIHAGIAVMQQVKHDRKWNPGTRLRDSMKKGWTDDWEYFWR